MSEVSDMELFHRWCARERAAGDELCRRHYEAVTRFFRGKVRGDAAEDLVQETFKTCIVTRERFRGDSKFRTFLFGMAYNVLLKHITRPRKDVLDIEGHELPADDPSLSTEFGRQHQQRQVLAALRSLPVEQQALLELYYWEDLSGSQISAALGVPEGTIRGRIGVAKRAFGAALAAVRRRRPRHSA